MANDLTGEFDVVAEFAIGAANRVLASMHRSERFLHSISTHVDDTITGPNTSLVGGIDAFGTAIANQERLAGPEPGPQRSPSAVARLVLDDVVNVQIGGVIVIQPSLLKGKAQVQVFPPTVAVPDTSGTRLTVRIPILSRYFPDAGTSPLAEFIRGEIQITASITQVVAQSARVIEVDLKAPNVQIAFTTSFTSRPLALEDLQGISLLLRNALQNSFLPSNATLPPNIAHIQFKTLRAGQSALAVLLNLSGGAGNPASLGQVFLGSGDDFAFAAGVDFIKASLQPTLDNILSQAIDPVRFDVSLIVTTVHVTYTITLSSATISLQTGKIVLEIKGHAHTSTSFLPDFDFTAKQDLTLGVDGATANLVIGDLSFDTSSFIVNQFKGGGLESLARARDNALQQSNAQSTVRRLLSADENLGGFLNALLNPPQKGAVNPPLEQPRLTYASADIQPSGIVLHGALAVPDYPPPHVEFEQIPTTTPITNVFDGPDYSALNSWIPGGVIQRFEWSRFGEQGVTVEPNRFIFSDGGLVATDGGLAPPPPVTVILPAYHPLCLTVRGSRISASGPVVAESVSATSCGFNTFPVVQGSFDTTAAVVPLVALPHPGVNGQLEVTGHTPARVDPTNTQVPNRLVHFPDDRSCADLAVLVDAIVESKRTDAPTAAIAVLSPTHFAGARFVSGLTYGDDENGAWSRLFGAPAPRPLTLLLGPKGNELWRYTSPLDKRALVDVLKRYLTPRKPLVLNVIPRSVRIDLPPPNVLFEYAPGRILPLRKIGAARLVFWKSTSRPSIEAVRDAARYVDARGNAPAVIAVNDGESPDLARRVFAEQKLTGSLLTDPDRTIARAYNIRVWPTTIVVDRRGLVTEVATGRDQRAVPAGKQA